jgi:hypothetical protein
LYASMVSNVACCAALGGTSLSHSLAAMTTTLCRLEFNFNFARFASGMGMAKLKLLNAGGDGGVLDSRWRFPFDLVREWRCSLSMVFSKFKKFI